MEDPTGIKSLIEKVQAFAATNIELYKLRAINTSADIASSVAARLAAYVVYSMFVIISSIGLALWLGEMFERMYLGFLAVAGIYLIAALLFHFMKQTLIETPVSNAIIRKTLG